MIDQATVEKIFDAAQIVEVVSDYVTLKKRELTTRAYVRFTTKKRPRLLYLPLREFLNVLAVVRAATR